MPKLEYFPSTEIENCGKLWYNNQNVLLHVRGGEKMAQDAVKKVISAEKSAEDKIALARERAKTIVAEAEKTGREMLAEAEASAEAEVKSRLSRADGEAERLAGEIQKKAIDEAEKLRTLAAGRMDKAAAFIAERVVKG